MGSRVLKQGRQNIILAEDALNEMSIRTRKSFFLNFFRTRNSVFSMLDWVAGSGLNSLVFSGNLGSMWATVNTIEMADPACQELPRVIGKLEWIFHKHPPSLYIPKGPKGHPSLKQQEIQRHHLHFTNSALGSGLTHSRITWRVAGVYHLTKADSRRLSGMVIDNQNTHI